LLSKSNNCHFLDIGTEAKVAIENTALACFAFHTRGLDQSVQGLSAIVGDGARNKKLTVRVKPDNRGIVKVG
jgi:hypothetical protein